MTKTLTLDDARKRYRWNGTDSTFEGVAVAGFSKLSGKPMVVLEDDRGLLHVYPVSERLWNVTDEVARQEIAALSEGADDEPAGIEKEWIANAERMAPEINASEVAFFEEFRRRSEFIGDPRVAVSLSPAPETFGVHPSLSGEESDPGLQRAGQIKDGSDGGRIALSDGDRTRAEDAQPGPATERWHRVHRHGQDLCVSGASFPTREEAIAADHRCLGAVEVSWFRLPTDDEVLRSRDATIADLRAQLDDKDRRIGELRPVAWARGIVSRLGSHEPPEYDVEMSWGDDAPGGGDWFPLYRGIP